MQGNCKLTGSSISLRNHFIVWSFYTVNGNFRWEFFPGRGLSTGVLARQFPRPSRGSTATGCSPSSYVLCIQGNSEYNVAILLMHVHADDCT